MKGFTLIELMMAIAITVVVAAGTYGLFEQFVRVQDRVTESGSVLESFQIGEAVLREDFLQAIPNRSVRPESGDVQPGIGMLEDETLSLTRMGWVQPRQPTAHRSLLQRLDYRWVSIDDPRCRPAEALLVDNEVKAGSCLLRAFTDHVDRAEDAQLRTQTLFNGVVDPQWSFHVVDEEGAIHVIDAWPPEDEDMKSARLLAVGLSFAYIGDQTADFLWAVPGGYE